MDRRPMNTPLQWTLVLLTLAVLVLEAVGYLDAAFPAPDPTIRFTCGHADSVRVSTTHWRQDQRKPLATRALPCGDTTAVTYGYLR